MSVQVNDSLKELFTRSVKAFASIGGFSDQEATQFYKNVVSGMKDIPAVDEEEKMRITTRSVLNMLISEANWLSRKLNWQKNETYRNVV